MIKISQLQMSLLVGAVITVATAATNTLSITSFNNNSRGTFNLFWSPDTRFHSGSIEVSVRAKSGVINQGGSIIWRAVNADNYYITRYNPLENNLRLYYVKDGRRVMLTDVGDLDIVRHQWFTLKVLHQGAQIEIWLNNNKLIETQDHTFTEAGGISL